MRRMRFSLLRVGLCVAGVWGATAAGACGGNVVVDGNATGTGTGTSTGLGGSGASTGFVTATNDVTSTDTGFGPSTTTTGGTSKCGCGGVCKTAAGCGLGSAADCSSFCDALAPAQFDCLCENVFSPDCNAVDSCVGVAQGDACLTGPAAASDCNGQVAACNAQPECAAIVACHAACGYGPSCQQQCDGAHPDGLMAFFTLISCTVCKDCGMACQGQAVTQYCPVPSPPPPGG